MRTMNGSFTTQSGAKIKVLGPGLTNTTDDIHCRCDIISQVGDIPQTVRRDNETKELIPYKTYPEWYKAKYGKEPFIAKVKK